MLTISTALKSQMLANSIRVELMRLQILALRWCLNGSMNNCLIELEQATQLESLLNNDYNRPNILHIRASELFALYLLITHQYYPTLASSYQLKNQTISVNDLSSYALEIYRRENQTEPFRADNLLGMARAYAQLGHTKQAYRVYKDIQHNWANSTDSSRIDRIVAEEANYYINHGSFTCPTMATIISLLFFLILIHDKISFLFI